MGRTEVVGKIPTWQTELQAHIAYLRGKKRSESYIEGALPYWENLGKEYGKPFSQLTKTEVEVWMGRMASEGLSGKGPVKGSTIAGIWNRVRALLRQRDNEEATKGISYSGLTESRIEKNDGDALLSPEESKEIAGYLKQPFKAMFLLQRFSGCRPRALLTLEARDVIFGNAGGHAYVDLHFRPESVKTKEGRITTIDNRDAIRELQAWLKTHERKGMGALLFPSPHKHKGERPYTADAFTRRLKRAARDAGITKRVYSYLARHSRISELRLSGRYSDSDICEQVGLKAGSPMLDNYSHTTQDDRRAKWLGQTPDTAPIKGATPEVKKVRAENAGLRAQVKALQDQMGLLAEGMEKIQARVFIEQELKDPPKKVTEKNEG